MQEENQENRVSGLPANSISRDAQRSAPFPAVSATKTLRCTFLAALWHGAKGNHEFAQKSGPNSTPGCIMM